MKILTELIKVEKNCRNSKNSFDVVYLTDKIMELSTVIKRFRLEHVGYDTLKVTINKKHAFVYSVEFAIQMLRAVIARISIICSAALNRLVSPYGDECEMLLKNSIGDAFKYKIYFNNSYDNDLCKIIFLEFIRIHKFVQ